MTPLMQEHLSPIGVVIIGLNAGRFLADCIESVLRTTYPRELLEIVYVDGGSRDGSASLAKRYPGVKVIELNSRHPTPGRGRNAGWRACGAPLIQFLDADTIVDPEWFMKAVAHLGDDVAAVCGMVRERHPERNIFHRLVAMEWIYETGPARYFGGNALVRRDVLEATGGFDEDLIAGEDPELSLRMRHRGYVILRIDEPMIVHDIDMAGLKKYMARSYRSGYAYAEIAIRFSRGPERLWLRELVRVVVRALAPAVLCATAVLSRRGWPWFCAAFFALVYPFFRLSAIRRRYGVGPAMSLAYACHASVVVLPQFAGAVRYLMGRLFLGPLRNTVRDPSSPPS